MAAGQPPRRLGRHLTAVQVTGLTVDATTGVFTPGTVYNLVFDLDELGHQTEQEREDIRPVNSTQKNEYVIGEGNVGTLMELKRTDRGSSLAKLKLGYTHCYVQWSEAPEGWNGYFLIGEYTGGVRGRGAQKAQLALRPCDPTTVVQMVPNLP